MALLVATVCTTIVDDPYWSKLNCEWHLAAYTLDYEFYDDRPWEDPECRTALMSVCERLLYPLEGAELDDEMRKVERGLGFYFQKQGIFMKSHIWPKRANGVLVEKDPMPAFAFFQNFGANMGIAQKLAIMITAQNTSETPAERNYKLYKRAVSKSRSALGRARVDESITALSLQNVNANLGLDDYSERTLNETEEYLRNFDLGEEAKWAKKFSAQAASTLSLVKDFKCFLEPWEDPRPEVHC